MLIQLNKNEQVAVQMNFDKNPPIKKYTVLTMRRGNCLLTREFNQDNNPTLKQESPEDKIDALVNDFIVKWCGKMSAHLLDTDENDGEELRQELKDLIGRC